MCTFTVFHVKVCSSCLARISATTIYLNYDIQLLEKNRDMGKISNIYGALLKPFIPISI